MSEFNKEYDADSTEKKEAVEAFEDFDMSDEETDAADEIFDTSDVSDTSDDIESVMAAVAAVEQAEAIAEEDYYASSEAEEEPAEVETDEDAAEEETAEVEEDEDATKEEPVEVEADEDATEEEPVEAETDVDATEEEPAEVEEDEDATNEEPVEVEADEDVTEEEPAEVEEDQDMTEEEPAEVEDDEDTAEEEPAEVETDEEIDIMSVAYDTDDSAETEEDFTVTDEPDDSEKSDAEIDIMSTIVALEAAANQSDEIEELADDDISASELSEETDTDDSEEAEETAEEAVDEDDYLDYDDSPRSKKIVSGKAAVITMLVTCFVTIALIVGAVWLGITMKKDIGVTVASYSDRFNACDTNDFALSSLLGTQPISMSDKECTLSTDDISALKSGKTVKKFNDMVNIKADTRFGKIVSMDITYDSSVDKEQSPSVTCMVLFGNTLSGLFDSITNSDSAFISAYTALVQKSAPAPQKGSEVYVYRSDKGISIYADYSKMAKTGKYSDVMLHIENTDPDYIHTKELDFSWLPFDFSSDKSKTSDSTTSPSDK